eukprot:scaffold15658_cov56-Attheya_sp.AAC.1
MEAGTTHNLDVAKDEDSKPSRPEVSPEVPKVYSNEDDSVGDLSCLTELQSSQEDSSRNRLPTDSVGASTTANTSASTFLHAPTLPLRVAARAGERTGELSEEEVVVKSVKTKDYHRDDSSGSNVLFPRIPVPEEPPQLHPSSPSGSMMHRAPLGPSGRGMSIEGLNRAVTRITKSKEKKRAIKHGTDNLSTWTSAKGGGGRRPLPERFTEEEFIQQHEAQLQTLLPQRLKSVDTTNHDSKALDTSTHSKAATEPSGASSNKSPESGEQSLLARYLQTTLGQDQATAALIARSFAGDDPSSGVDFKTARPPHPPSTSGKSGPDESTIRMSQLRMQRSEKMDQLIRSMAESRKRQAMLQDASNSSLPRPSQNASERTFLKTAPIRYPGSNKMGGTEQQQDTTLQDVTLPYTPTRPGAFHTAGRAFGAMPRAGFTPIDGRIRGGSRAPVDARARHGRSSAPLKAHERQELTTSTHSRRSRTSDNATSRGENIPNNSNHDRSVSAESDGPEEPGNDEEDGLNSSPRNDEIDPIVTPPDLDERNADIEHVIHAVALSFHDTDDNGADHHGSTTSPSVWSVEATPLPSNFKLIWRDARSRRCMIMLPALFIFVTAIGLIIAGVSGHLTPDKSNRNMPTPLQTYFPTSSPTVNSDELQAILEAFSSVEDLEQVGSPQQKAMLWLANKDRIGTRFTDPLYPQRYAMVVLFYATQGGGNRWLELDKFLSPIDHECAWGPSVQCEDGISSRRLTGLDLGRHGLTGRIPTEIGLLTDIEILRMAENSLSGFIPNEIGNLLKLSRLDLQTNALSGSIPDELGHMKKLTDINFCANKLTGSIPNSLFNASGLKTLEVCDNQMSGTLSLDFEKLTFLTKLNVRNNTMNGTLPVSALGDLGSIPLRNWRFARLEEFTGSNNQIRGEFPTNLTGLSGAIPFIRLKKLDFSHNHLTGTIPDETGYLPSLEYFAVYNNTLTGPLPDVFPPQIEYFSIKNTMVGGSLPTEIGNIRSLRLLDLTNSSLTGSIPSEFGKLNGLDIVYLNGNKIDGTLPEEMGDMTLSVLNLDDNLISGTIPSTFGKLGHINFISAENNMLTGTIPPALANLDNLDELRLKGNDLEGSVPEGLCALNLKLRVDDLVQCSCCHATISTSLDGHDLLWGAGDEP